ncbi:MAG: small ribosomal subunit Rsm22 family protein [Chloroflexota bacterium]|nr:small ribosomal subunit Rsm22 family protein [Chloroflexota bacterium]
MQLPADLSATLQSRLDEIPSKDIVRAAGELSKRYRASGALSSGPAVQSPLDAAAYAAYRLPASYAAIRAVLDEVRERRPDLDPSSLLDIGGGPGTAAWAAIGTWPDLDHITILERDPWMIQIGKDLAAGANSPVIRHAIWRQGDIDGLWPAQPILGSEIQPADITVAAYVMGELSSSALTEFVHRLWEYTADTCVILEPGTPRGFALIRQAGDQLVSEGVHVLAPFPSTGIAGANSTWHCLEGENDWCHFSQRVPRTRMLRNVKGATLSYEDEKYSYIAVSRQSGLPIAARVIRHPQVRSGHIRLVLCTAEGVKHVIVARSNRQAYKLARDLKWGSAIPVEEAGLYGLDGPFQSQCCNPPS